MSTRPALGQTGLGIGKRTRLHRLLFQQGLRNGTALFLPYDQGLEHGPRDFFANPDAGDPAYTIRLAIEGGFNAVVLQVGLAEKFYGEVAGEVPLILKLNGKTDIAPDAEAFSPLQATVADAVRLGADAVGYTLYVGTPALAADFEQFRRVREEAHSLGMPVIVWAYPRGSAIAGKGGPTSFYAVDYAARVASELGADLVKVNVPDPSLRTGVPPPYDGSFTQQQAIEAVVRSANRSLVVFSGGPKHGDHEMLANARSVMAAGATGLIYGRNVWQRPHDASLRFIAQLREILASFPANSG